LKIGRKATAKFAIYIALFSAVLFYSVFISNYFYVFATSYYPIAGNTCAYRQSNANDCTTVSNQLNCASGTYRPSFSCTASNPSCTAETASASCAVCGDCNAAGTCVAKTCVAGNQYQCAAGKYCTAVANTCSDTLANGVSCSACSSGNYQCTSGNCANGGASVCCDSGYRCCSVDGDCLTGYGCASNDCKLAYPQWSSNVSVINTVSYSEHSSFNVTWTQTNFSISVALIEGNWSGVATNYTMTLLATNVYNYNATLPAGAFYWKFYANSSVNVWNSTPQFFSSVPVGIVATCNAGGPYLKNSVVNVVGNVTYNGAGKLSNVVSNITNASSVYVSKTTNSGSDGGYYVSYNYSEINSLDLGTYGVNVTARNGSDVYVCNSTLELLYLQQINCQTRTVYVGGNVLYASSGTQVSSGRVTAAVVGSGITNSTTFSNGRFSIYLTGCFLIGNLYTFSILAADNSNKTSSTQINFIVI